MSYVAAAKVNTHATHSHPQGRIWRSIPTVFIQRKRSSIRFRSLAYLIARCESCADPPGFCTRLVVAHMRRNSHLAQSLDELPLVVSLVFSPNVTRPQPGSCSTMAARH